MHITIDSTINIPALNDALKRHGYRIDYCGAKGYVLSSSGCWENGCSEPIVTIDNDGRPWCHRHAFEHLRGVEQALRFQTTEEA